MLRDDAVVLVQEKLGYRSDLKDSIIRNMKLAQSQLELGPTKPWFLLSEDSTTTLTPEESRVGLPDDFLCETEDAALIYVPDDVDEEEWILGKRDYDTLLKTYKGVVLPSVARPPRYYALRGDYFIIFPKPDAAYTLKMVYYKRGESLDTNIENVWLKQCPYLLMGKAGLLVSPGLRDLNATNTFNSWEREGRLAMYTRNEDREHAGRDDYQMGGAE
jgi:hypothetical protein